VRLFVSVEPPEAVLDMLRELPRPENPALRWTTSGQWHVTLRFLGAVEDPAPVAEALARVPAALRAAGTREVRARLGPASAWFEGRRILQMPVSGLDGLAAAVTDATAKWGDPPRAPFVGHLTLARVRGTGRGDRLLAGSVLEASWPVERFELKSSQLGRGGARYETQAEVTLSATR
jgi:2'-5' RNA ligase